MTGPGTLPRNPKNRLEFLRYATTGEAPLSARELVERIPEVLQFARVSAEDGPPMPFDQPQQLKELSLKMTALLADPDLAGIVFAHGTNTIEETAYFLSLTVKSEKPIVIVGAQRPFSTLSSDAPLNLLNAIRVAAAPASRGKGTLVVLNDTVQAARDVTKTNTYRVETFQSREIGILGYADPDRIGLSKDARFDMEGFRTTLQLRAEFVGQPQAAQPDKYLDLSFYERARQSSQKQ
jgi:L-asparaginase